MANSIGLTPKRMCQEGLDDFRYHHRKPRVAAHIHQSPAILICSGRYPARNTEGSAMNNMQEHVELPAPMPTPDGGFGPCPIVMAEEELIRFLRIPEISSAANHHHVIENLKRVHGLPRIHLCGKTVSLADSVRKWLEQRVTWGH
jgi:hypothetical protein